MPVSATDATSTGATPAASTPPCSAGPDEPAGQPGQQRQGDGAGRQHERHPPGGRAHAPDVGEGDRRAGAEHQHRQGDQDRSAPVQAPPGLGKRDAEPGDDQNQGQQEPVEKSGHPRQPRLQANHAVAARHVLTS
jgi:hypothetical protein